MCKLPLNSEGQVWADTGKRKGLHSLLLSTHSQEQFLQDATQHLPESWAFGNQSSRISFSSMHRHTDGGMLWIGEKSMAVPLKSEQLANGTTSVSHTFPLQAIVQHCPQSIPKGQRKLSALKERCPGIIHSYSLRHLLHLIFLFKFCCCPHDHNSLLRDN